MIYATLYRHVAFRLRTEEELRSAYKELKKTKVPISSTVNYGITKSVYFFDPDGHELPPAQGLER